jgi:hypothetical protein
MYPKFIRFVAALVKSAMANDHVHGTANITACLPQLVFLNQLKSTDSTSVGDCIRSRPAGLRRRDGGRVRAVPPFRCVGSQGCISLERAETAAR